MSEPANGMAAAMDRAEALLGQLGDRLKETGAKLQEAPPPVVPEGRPATERAEETLDRAGERIGVFAAALSQRVRKSVALAREEAEDIWAEAQSLRRKSAP